MSIKLFEHNKTAYDAARQMLKETGKATIIHPTGTGKSFIGFKFCEDNPDKTVCWLSPSEYIFKTQIENLRAASDGYTPDNLKFFTYAKLMLMSEDELAGIKPDLIVVDEFHRIGAAEWGNGFNRFKSIYPNTPILGLSATAIRYLDNCRNMAEEIFDGNIASEITLGEAIVRGILRAPKYVLSVYSYQNEYDRMEVRVRRTKNEAVRKNAESYLEALRRALEMADGLDEIFDRHMANRTGKYLVFCADHEHLKEMVSKVSDFFGRIDSKPHIYTAYSEDPATDRAFSDFKKDRSDHLKLLFCIDMLNEGVHVDDVSGVILFRPTISPIVYKQQIGRALSVSGTETPVIFDIVDNINNLYSIDSVKHEMQLALHAYEGEGIEVTSHFKIFDEIRDAKVLFQKLNDVLTTSWDTMYSYAKEYYEEHNSLDVPKRYKTKEGYSLGSWISVQRRVYAGLTGGILGEDRIKKLNDIGMIWNMHATSWDKFYDEAKRYFVTFGNLNVPALYETEIGVKLGAWISNQRSLRKSKSGLPGERIKKLDSIGMVWDVNEHIWEEYFDLAEQYYKDHGDLRVPAEYKTPNGRSLGAWISRNKNAYRGTYNGAKLTDEQIERLSGIGMVWESNSDQSWERGYGEAVKYFEDHGHLDIAGTYVSPSGYKLGRWIAHRREKGREGHTEEQRKQLDELKFLWKKPDPWEQRYELAKAWYEEHGDLKIPAQYKVDGIWLSKWVNEQRQIYIGNRVGKKLSDEQVEKLNAIGMEWGDRNRKLWSKAWNENYKQAKEFFNENGHLNITTGYKIEYKAEYKAEYKGLQRWIVQQRKRRREGKLSEEQIELLNDIGMIWELDNPWELGYQHALEYYEKFGDLNAHKKYVCEDEYKLGQWLSNQRANYKSTDKYRMLSEEQIKRLEAIGMVWNPSEEKWMEGFNHAREYMQKLEGLKWKVLYVSPDGFKTGEWIRGQVRKYRENGLKQERQRMLEEIGVL